MNPKQKEIIYNLQKPLLEAMKTIEFFSEDELYFQMTLSCFK